LASAYRFEEYTVDRAAYRLTRNGQSVDVTPKLLDLLLHLLDHAGTLVTKEDLLDALWPDANVTDNALTQAVSELRQALGDDAGAPRFIKTIARRGYRFVAPVETVAPGAQFAAIDTSPPASTPAPVSVPVDENAIAVLDFTNVSGDADAAWLCAGIAETVSADLGALGRFRVIDRWRVVEAVRRSGDAVRGSGEAVRRSGAALHEVAAALGVRLAVIGSFQRIGDRVRITARVVDVSSGDALADAKVDGLIGDIFALQDEVVTQFRRELGFAPDAARVSRSRETASLDAFRAVTEGWLKIETLDVRELPRAIADFERAVSIDPGYALAYTGLATAEFASYESTRSDTLPARELLARAIAHGRRAVELDEGLAEAHGTLALILVSAWDTPGAIRAARRAVAIEPGNWRHLFRLGHASWGEERLRAGAATLALYPDFAFAFFQSAMVHVARGRFAEAERVLRHGAAVQDRQIDRGERYPALGLHWLLGLVRLREGDIEDALDEFTREAELAQPERLYGREYTMHAHLGRGCAYLEAARPDAAIEAFRAALALYPDQPQSEIGLARAYEACGQSDAARAALDRAETLASVLDRAKPIESAMVRAQIHAVRGDRSGVRTALEWMLADAPPGFAGWTIPVEPHLRQVADSEELTKIVARLADRAT
jgi:DNA-binding winged helix-turn-helix (wHTH) protein/tetratricopeptide (TPR) repeat protein